MVVARKLGYKAVSTRGVPLLLFLGCLAVGSASVACTHSLSPVADVVYQLDLIVGGAVGRAVVCLDPGTYTGCTLPGLQTLSTSSGDGVHIAGLGDVVIDCLFSGRLVYGTANNVTLSNMTIINSNMTGAIRAEAGSRVKLINVRVNNCTGEAVNVIDSDLTVTSSAFFSNSPTALLVDTSTLVIEDSTIADGGGGDDGGGIRFVAVTSLIARNLTCTGNTVTDQGGCIRATTTTMSIYDSTFTDNSAVTEGSAIMLNGASVNMLMNNTVIRGNTSPGGAAFYSGFITTFYVGYSTFESNRNSGDSGGALYASSNTQVELESCVFSGNTCFQYGGAAYLSGVIDITNTTFQNNRATQASNSRGGALRPMGTLTLTVNNCLFEGNNAFLGGAVYQQPTSGSSTFSNVVFKSNLQTESGSDGAGFYLRSTAVVTNCTFEGNSAPDTGGAFRVYPGGPATIEGCTFHDNTASTLGAAIFKDGANIRVAECTFTDNWSPTGAIDIVSGSMGLYSSVFENNGGTSTGGVTFTATAQVTVDDCEFRFNTGNTGSAFRLTSSATMTLTNSIFENNSSPNAGTLKVVSSTVTVTSTSFTSNTAEHGGAVSLNGATFNCTACSFTSNTANQYGGAVDCDGASVSFIIGSNITDNSAGINGSAIDVLGASSLSLPGTTATCNYGPGVAVRATEASTTVDLTGAAVANNYRTDGSAAFDYSPSLVLPSGLLENVAADADATVIGYALVPSQDPRVCPSAAPCESILTCANGGQCYLPTNASVFVACNCSNATGYYGYTCEDTVCGDAVAAGVEECDDGNADNDDACRSNCTLNVCGDGIHTPGIGEECDDGNADNDDACRNNCTLNVCGDGINTPGIGEECDDGNPDNNDACRNNCTLNICGDSIVTSGIGEECDDGNADNDDYCRNNCTLNVCGDGIHTPDIGEECDDGNADNNDACRNNCTLNICGDSIVTSGIGEECDDGNADNNDACRSNCTLNICGDGIHTPGIGEQCDDGNANNDDSCSNACVAHYCGDGLTTPGIGEECDDANSNDDDDCSNCVSNCGNGVVDPDSTEQCDDGNNVDGDGCSATCTFSCGNGRFDPGAGEECDDGNSNNRDDCLNTCKRPKHQCADDEWDRRGSTSSQGTTGAKGCVACPLGGYCDGSRRCLPRRGFWSRSPYHAPVECGVYSSCPGVVDEEGNFVGELDEEGTPITAVCNSDYGDEVCAKCQSKRFKDNQRCVPCEANAAAATGGLVVATVGVVVVLAIGVALLPDKRLDFLVTLILGLQMFVLVGRDATRKIPGHLGKRVSTVYRYFSVITFDVEFMQLGCAQEEALDFADVFWATLVLVAVAAALFTLAAVLNVTARYALGRLKIPFVLALRYHLVHVFLILGVAAYVQVTMRVLQSINCIDVYGETRLHVELSTACYGEEHMAIAITSWVLMAFYVVAFPAFVFYIGWMRPAALRGPSSSTSASSSKWLSLSAVSQVADYSASGDGSRKGSSGSGSVGGDGESSDVELGSAVSEREYSEAAYPSGGDEEQQEEQLTPRTYEVVKTQTVYAYRSQYGFLVRGLRRQAYWFQALRIVVMFAVVVDVVTPKSTTAKLFGGALILAINVVIVGLVWPFKNRMINVIQICSGLATAFQTVVFIQNVADVRHQSAVMFVLSLVVSAVVLVVVGLNLFRNQSLLLAPTASSSSWLTDYSTSELVSTSSEHSYSGSSGSGEYGRDSDGEEEEGSSWN